MYISDIDKLKISLHYTEKQLDYLRGQLILNRLDGLINGIRKYNEPDKCLLQIRELMILFLRSIKIYSDILERLIISIDTPYEETNLMLKTILMSC